MPPRQPLPRALSLLRNFVRNSYVSPSGEPIEEEAVQAYALQLWRELQRAEAEAEAACKHPNKIEPEGDGM